MSEISKELFDLIDELNKKKRELVWKYEAVEENNDVILKRTARNQELSAEIEEREAEIVALVTKLTARV